MSGYENPWRDSSPSRRDRDRDYYTGSVPSGLDSTYPPMPPTKMPSEEYHGATRFDAYDTGLDNQRPLPLTPYGGSAAYASSSSFDPLRQSSPRLRDYGIPAQPSPRLRDYENRKEASPLLRDYEGRSSSSPRIRDSPSMQATGVASGINAARGIYDSFFPATPQDDPVTPDRRSRRRPSHTPSSSSRSRSHSPDLAFGHNPSGSRVTRDTGVGASPPGKTLVETMTPLASAAASAAGSALSNFFNSPPRSNNNQAPIPTRPPNDRQSSSFYDYLAAAYPMVTGNRPSQQPQTGNNNLEFAGMSLDKDWIMKQLTETNPWVLIGLALVAIMIISSIIATLIKLAIFAAVIYLVFVFGIQNGAIQSFAAGAGREGPPPPIRRRVDQRPGARRW